MRRRFVAWAALLTAAFLTGCHAGPEVTRLANGRDASGKWIHPDAYAAYLEGAIAEARGDAAHAASAYTRTIEEDPDAAEAWARLGAVLCLTAKVQANRAFLRAQSLAVDLEDPWLAAAECDLKRGNGKNAVENASRALALGPNDPEASRVLASALERTGDSPRARRVLHALTLLRPSMAPHTGRPVGEGAVLQALERGDVTAARSAARQERLPGADVALLALSMGRPDLASQMAELLLLSDEGDSTARIAALTSADLEHKDDGLARFARPLPSDRTRPSAPAAELMAELLSRRVGSDAARAWAEGYSGTAPARGDPGAKPVAPPVSEQDRRE